MNDASTLHLMSLAIYCSKYYHFYITFLFDVINAPFVCLYNAKKRF